MSLIKNMLAGASALCITMSTDAFSAESFNTFSRPGSFTLERVKSPTLDIAVFKANQAVQCRSTVRVHCPDTLLSTGLPLYQASSLKAPAQRSGHSPWLPADEYAAELPKNLRVMFILDTMENEIVSGGGVQPSSDDVFAAGIYKTWELHSSAATEERYNNEPGETGVVGLPAPGPGELWNIPHANLVYDGLVHDGCGNVPVFPIEFDGEIVDVDDDDAVLGSITKFDNSTLVPNGYWKFSYTIRAMDAQGGVSNYHFNGRVSVLCTNVDNLL